MTRRLLFGLKPAPLSGSLFLVSIIGIILSGIYVLPRSLAWGTAFLIIFGAMFVSCFIAMTKGPVIEKPGF